MRLREIESNSMRKCCKSASNKIRKIKCRSSLSRSCFFICCFFSCQYVIFGTSFLDVKLKRNECIFTRIPFQTVYNMYITISGFSEISIRFCYDREENKSFHFDRMTRTLSLNHIMCVTFL
jgi:hypothetical protein